MVEPPKTTALLRRASNGDDEAVGALFVRLKQELRSLAGRLMRGERRHHTLQPTELVDEAYIRMVREEQVPWIDRVHFKAIAGRAMRQILANHARAKRRLKRGAGRMSVALTGSAIRARGPAVVDVIILNDALESMERDHSRPYHVFTLRELGGCTVDEAAARLGISERTVKADYRLARAFLQVRLSEEAA